MPARHSTLGRLLPACLILIPGMTAIAQERSGSSLALAGAPALRVVVADLPSDPGDPLDPSAFLWSRVPATRLVLNRTPRLFRTERTAQPAPPAAEVRAVRRGVQLVVRLSWDDATADAPRGPEAKKGEAGVSEILYKRPTRETSQFSDAAAVMIPEAWKGPAFPSLVMGDDKSPALLYHWTASGGSHVLRALGRASTTRLDQSFPARAAHDGKSWTATLEIPAPAIETGYPIAFALWDGHHADRDGMKFFSVWYVLAPNPTPDASARRANAP